MVGTMPGSMNPVRSFAELRPEEWRAAGGKGAALARLVQAGLPVPEGFVLLPSSFDENGLRAEAWEEVRRRLAALRVTERAAAVAVRSSGGGEDSANASFAGGFTSVLGVRDDEEVRGAIERVYASRQNERAAIYSKARGLEAEARFAVVVQRLVDAIASGIMFTANPVTGNREEVVISAAWGLGEAVVGGVVTPDSLVVDKASGVVLRRETADKAVMTVRVPGGTEEQPVPAQLRRAPVLSDAEASALAGLGRRIEALFGAPVDVEWARDGQGFAVVQARPVTALPAPEPPPPTEWRLPEGAYAAMRNNIVELMADPLSPLFRTLGLSAVNAGLHRVFALFFGEKRILPAQVIVTVNGYAYFNGSLSAGNILWLLGTSVAIARRMFRGALERWLDAGRPAYLAAVERWRTARWQDMRATSLLGAARELTQAASEAFGILDSGPIPGAWISEGLFTFVYNKLAKREGDPPAPVYLMGFDSLPARAEKSLADLATWVRGRATLAEYVQANPGLTLAADLERHEAPADVEETAWGEWRTLVGAHLKQYGHTIYNLDFASPVPADDPAPLLEVCRLHLAGAGTDPRARQQAAAERREQATAALRARGGWRARLCRRLLATAQRYAALREDGQADIGLAYPLVRQALRELGRRFAEVGVVERWDDVFWLEEDEAGAAAQRLDRGESLPGLAGEVAKRKAAWRAAKRVSPPLSIMQLRILGKGVVITKRPSAKKYDRRTLRGVAASPGCVTGTARVIAGPEEFGRMRTGDVLVAPLTTPAWTPLFARAAAIVTDVGGPLSHGSIVAREYGVPAVLGTGDATRRIRNGQVITVDGNAGLVHPRDEGGDASEA